MFPIINKKTINNNSILNDTLKSIDSELATQEKITSLSQFIGKRQFMNTEDDVNDVERFKNHRKSRNHYCVFVCARLLFSILVTMKHYCESEREKRGKQHTKTEHKISEAIEYGQLTLFLSVCFQRNSILILIGYCLFLFYLTCLIIIIILIMEPIMVKKINSNNY